MENNDYVGRLELYALIEAFGNTGGGGEGGTSNYNELINLPKINNVMLTGSKSLSQLKILSSEFNSYIQRENPVDTDIIPVNFVDGTVGYITIGKIKELISIKQTQTNWNENDSSSVSYIKNKPTSLPASDVHSWAKRENKPTYTKNEIGLGNVDNTTDLKKPVSEAVQTALDKKIETSFGVYSQQTELLDSDEFVINTGEEVKRVMLSQIKSTFNNTQFKGWFSTETDLIASYPSAQAGDNAIVGDTDTVWVWSVVNSSWTNTGKKSQVQSVNGKTGVVTLTANEVGLDKVNNTSDIDKPLSTVQKEYIDNAVSNLKFVENVLNGDNISIDNTDPQNPIISANLNDLEIWLPNVSPDGEISWEKSTSSVAPVPQNIKGDKGDKGDTGEKGENGYTPVKGVDYFTPADIDSLGISSKADTTYVDGLVGDISTILASVVGGGGS